MAEFQFITKQNQSPQGKQKVYFTCHPDDFERTFESIKNDILDRQDVAVFYLEPHTLPGDVADYELLLGEMQLFVIPITTNLLTSPNRAMDTEVPFALEKVIPILPIMIEDGLATLFNKRFGSLEYLNKRATDPFSIPYEERLTKYLESIIIGDELAEQIRAEFDAYIFLSYRKKDKPYADALMKLIHSNEFARDIAIWYDGFLIPGENFNDAIKEKLEKSEIFALVITPNLLEMPGGKPNYVMKKEYPTAREMGKPILPAEMLSTDLMLLSDKYNGIPVPVSTENAEEIKAYLEKMIKELALPAKVKDSRHIFFIGLAYHSQTDVEKNKELALELITLASDVGYIPATQKLVSMYRNGDGVKKDYEKMEQYQIRLANQCIKSFEEKPDADLAAMMIESMIECDNSMISTGFLERAIYGMYDTKRRFEEIIDYFDQEQAIRFRTEINNNIGDVNMVYGWLNDAEESYRNNLETLEQTVKETDTPENRRALSICYTKLGNTAKAYGKLVEAEEWYRKSFEINKRATLESNTPESRRTLALSYDNMGDIVFSMGKLREAEEWYRKALRIYNELDALAEQDEEETDCSDIANSYFKLGEVTQASGYFSTAKGMFSMSLDTAKSNLKQFKTIDNERRVISCYLKLGEVSQEKGYLSSAYDYYQEGYYKIYEVEEHLKHFDSEMAAVSMDKANAEMRLGDITRLKGEYKEAEEWYLSSLGGFDYVKKCMLNIDVRRWISDIYNRLGILYAAMGKEISESYPLLCKSISIRSEVVKETESVQARIDLIESILDLVKLTDWDISEVETLFQNAYHKSEALVNETDHPGACRYLALSCIGSGRIATINGDYSEAEKMCRNALELCENQKKEEESITSDRDIADCYAALGEIAKAQGRFDEAHTWYAKSVNTLFVLVKYYGLSCLCGDLSKTFNAYEKITSPQNPSADAVEVSKNKCEIQAILADEERKSEERKKAKTYHSDFGSSKWYYNRNHLISTGSQLIRDVPEIVVYEARAEALQTPRSLMELSFNYTHEARLEYNFDTKEAWLRKSLETNKLLAEKSGSPEHYGWTSKMYEILAENAQSFKQFHIAEKWYLKRLEYDLDTAAITGADKRGCYLSCYERLGGNMNKSGDYVKAEGWYLKMLEVHKCGSDEITDKNRNGISYTYQLLGNNAKTSGDFRKAEGWYLKMLEVNSGIPGEPIPENRKSKALSYQLLSDNAKQFDKPGEAEQWYLKWLEISEAVAKESTLWEDRYMLREIYNLLGEVTRSLNKLSDAEVWYQKSAAIYEKSVWEQQCSRDLKHLAEHYIILGEITKERGKLEETEEWYLKLVKVDEALAKTNREELCTALFESYNRLGDINCEMGRYHEAEMWYQKNIDAFETLLEEESYCSEYRIKLFVVYCKLAKNTEASGDLSKAIAQYHKCLDLSGNILCFFSLTPETHDFVSYEENMIDYHLGDIAKKQGDLQRAEKYYRWGIHSFESSALMSSFTTMGQCNGIAIGYQRLSTLAEEQGNSEKSKEYLSKSRAIENAISEASKLPEIDQKIDCPLLRLGITLKDNEMLEHVLAYWERLCERSSEDLEYKRNKEKVLKLIDAL